MTLAAPLWPSAALATSLNNASRLTDSDRAAVLAKRVMDDLLAAPSLPRGQLLQGRFEVRETGLEGGWRASVEPFEKLEVQRMAEGIDRVRLEVWWTRGPFRRTFPLDGYRIAAPAPLVPR